MKGSRSRIILIVIFFIVIFLIIKFKNNFREDWRLNAYEIHGIDISHYQLDVDFEKLKNETPVQFVFVKATEGVTFKDDHFKKNWKALKEKDFIRGAYHFYRPSVLGRRQAQEFIKTVSLEKGDLPPVLDLEETDNRSDEIVMKGVKNWLETIEAHYEVKPIIYVNQNYYYKYIKGNFDEYPIWLAVYRWDKPDVPEGAWKFWQYSDRGWRKGIEGRVDLNVFYGDQAALDSLRIK